MDNFDGYGAISNQYLTRVLMFGMGMNLRIDNLKLILKVPVDVSKGTLVQ